MDTKIVDLDLREQETEKDVPFGGFFGDMFFTLLYKSSETLPNDLLVVKCMLEIVSNKKERKAERAHAALLLGREVVSRAASLEALKTSDKRHALHWFDLAMNLNCVEAAEDCAKLYLADAGQELRQLDEELLPVIVKLNSTGLAGELSPNRRAHLTWLRGARLALRHVQRKFAGWDQGTFDAALNCILCFLAAEPSRGRFQIPAMVGNVHQGSAVLWMKPLWTRLVRASASLHRAPEEYVSEKREQIEAALLCVKNRSVEEDLDELIDFPEREPEKAPGPLQTTVIRGVIPRSPERSEMEYLRQYDALREPIALTAMPDLDQLQAIQSALSHEFPWAEDAVAAVLSELVARKRHGVAVLGMSPILLVGSPGGGKTRFCRRVSDLLGTPNTVINLAGMTDVKTLKGVTRGWASNRTSRIVEFILQAKTANPLFVLDEIDKTGRYGGNGGDPLAALLDLLEPGNAARYSDVYLITECDLSHCMYIATSNSLERLPPPLLSRLRLVYFPEPGPEHSAVIVEGMVRDLEQAWRLPEGVISLCERQQACLEGLPPRQMRQALVDILASGRGRERMVLH